MAAITSAIVGTMAAIGTAVGASAATAATVGTAVTLGTIGGAMGLGGIVAGQMNNKAEQAGRFEGSGISKVGAMGSSALLAGNPNILSSSGTGTSAGRGRLLNN